MDCKWRGQVIQKFPMDLMLLQEVIYENRPDIIVEIGTKYGASALFLQDILDLNGGGKVVTIDIKDQVKEEYLLPFLENLNESRIINITFYHDQFSPASY